MKASSFARCIDSSRVAHYQAILGSRSEAELERLARDGNWIERYMVAANVFVSKEVLVLLSHNHDPWVIWRACVSLIRRMGGERNQYPLCPGKIA